MDPPATDPGPPIKRGKLLTSCSACLAGPEKLSHTLVETVNKRDYNNPILSHISSHLHTKHEYFEAQSKAEFIETHRLITKLHADYDVRVINSVAEVDEYDGKAKIWLSLEVTGYPKNVRREGISLLYWRVSRGEWLHYRSKGLTGGGGGD